MTIFSEFLDCAYLKGEVIAVRSEGMEFFLAEVLKNIEEKELDNEFKVSLILFQFLVPLLSDFGSNQTEVHETLI